MEPISISYGIDNFKKGVFDTLALFKKLYQDKSNILIQNDKGLFINNFSQLLDADLKSNSPAYNFGISFVKDNIRYFRENICVSPILYMLSLELLLKKVHTLRELEQYKDVFSYVCDKLMWFYGGSNLERAVISKEDIYSLYPNELSDPFLKGVIDVAYTAGNVEIQESKENKIVASKYYKIKGTLICGSRYVRSCRIFVVTTLTRELFINLAKLNTDILVVCSGCDFDIEQPYKISVVKVTPTTLFKAYDDICWLSGFGKGFYNLNVDTLNNYSFGILKDYKFSEGTLFFSVDKYLLANDKRLAGLNKPETRHRYYALQGKNTIIYVQEEYLENVKELVSNVKSLTMGGIFYDDIKTLKLLLQMPDNSSVLNALLKDLLMSYLKIYGLNQSIIDEVISSTDFKSVFDPRAGKYTDKQLFQSLDYYLNTFRLLDSNINVLRQIY